MGPCAVADIRGISGLVLDSLAGQGSWLCLTAKGGR